MHEVSIVEALIEQAQTEVKRSGHDSRVTRLEVVIGRLSGVNVDSIRFAFQLLAPGTLLETAQLDIAEPKAACCCRTCGVETEIDQLAVQCPQCGSGYITIEGGQDLLLKTIDLEE